MKIAIVGAGAIGGWIAARLALAGRDPAVLVRPGRELSTLTLSDGDERRSVAIRSSDRAATFGPQDVVVIAVKAFALAEAAAAAKPLIGPDTRIVPMVNGVPWWFADPTAGERRSRRANRVGAARRARDRLRRPCRRPPRREADIVVQHADRLILGEPGGGQSERVAAIADLFARSGIRAEAERGYPPRHLVQGVGQYDDEPLVRADRRDRRPNSSPSAGP